MVATLLVGFCLPRTGWVVDDDRGPGVDFWDISLAGIAPSFFHFFSVEPQRIPLDPSGAFRGVPNATVATIRP